MKGFFLALALIGLAVKSAAADDPVTGGVETLEVLKSQFEELREDIGSAQARFDARYEEELKKLEATATEAGNLALVMATRKEAESFKTRKGAPPASSQPEVARMQKIYSDESARIIAEDAQKTGSLVRGYRTKLAELRVQLTKGGEIDAALQVQAEIDKLNAAWPAGAGTGVGTSPPPAGSRPSPLGEQWRYKNGLVVTLYPRAESQVRDKGFIPYARLRTMDPLGGTREIKSLTGWGYEANKNAVAVGYLKIEEPGDYQFNSNSFYDRNALYVRNEDSPLCGYRDGEGRVQTINLPKGMVRIISIGYVDARGSCRVRWKPPGQEGMSPIPDELLYHTEEDKRD